MLKFQITIHGNHGAKYHVYAKSYVSAARAAVDRFCRINRISNRGSVMGWLTVNDFGRSTAKVPSIRTIRTW